MSDNLICEKDEIKDLMPYEKCMEFGAGSLTDTELVAASNNYAVLVNKINNTNDLINENIE